MTDFKELNQLDYEHSAVYSLPNGDVLQFLRSEDKPPIRQIDGKGNTIYDFVNGYCEDQNVYNMKSLYMSLDNDDLISISSASGRDMTADVRLFLSARDYLGHLKAIKAPDYAIESQKKIAEIYLDHLKPYGDAAIVMRRSNLPFVNLDEFETVNDYLKSSLDRMDAVCKGKVYVLLYYRTDDINRQMARGEQELQPSCQPVMYIGQNDVAREMAAKHFDEATFSSFQELDGEAKGEPEPVGKANNAERGEQCAEYNGQMEYEER